MSNNTPSKKSLFICSAIATAASTAEAITMDTTVTLGDLLNSSNPSLSGSFDVSSVLSDFNNTSNRFTLNSAQISVMGYSTIDSSTSVDYTSYTLTSQTTRNTSYSYPYSYRYSYSCGWSTCYSYRTSYQYVSRTAYDRDYDRDATTHIEDAIVDEMTLQIGGDAFTAQASETINTLTFDGRVQTDYNGNYENGYNRYFTNSYTNTNAIFGDIFLDADASTSLLESLISGSNEFEWMLSASLGHFTADSISLSVDYDVEPLSQVPVPAAVWLFGSGLLAILSLSGRRKKEIV